MAVSSVADAASPSAPRESAASPSAGWREHGGYVLLLAVWILFEYGRPTLQAFKIPMMATIVLFLAALAREPKRWRPQVLYSVLFWALMVVHVPLARNYYTAFWSTYDVTVNVMVLFAIVQLVDSVAKLRFIVGAFLATYVFVGAWAATHGGYGPLGAAVGQDQNYVAHAMSVGLSLAFFSIFAARTTLRKVGLGAAAVLFALATLAGFSRGGFVALSAVGIYCWFHAPRKVLGVLVVAVLAGAAVVSAPEGYWDEMRTITDTSEGTADMRIEFWKIAWWQFLDHPIAGVGPANYRWYAGEYQSPEQHAKFGRSFSGAYVTHSLYFELLAERGLLGVLLFGGVLALNVRDTRRVAWIARGSARAGSRHARELLSLARGLEGALLGMLVSSLFLSALYGSYFWVLTGMIATLRICADDWVARGGPDEGPASEVEASDG